MKNKGSLALFGVTAAAVIFVSGFFLGRWVKPSGIAAVMHTSPVPASTGTGFSTSPPATTVSPSAQSPTSPPVTQTLPVNINTADVQALDGLPGIGPVLAQRIVDYRNEYGPFTTPEEIGNVPGIGEKKLAAILDFITVGGST